MTTERRNKMVIPMVITLLTLGLAGSPGRSAQDPDSITPLATIFSAGALLNYDRAAQHYQLYLGRDAMIEGAGGHEPFTGASSEDSAKGHYSRL